MLSEESLNVKGDGEKGDGKIIRKRVSTLKPSPENSSALYKAVDQNDPEIVKLAKSIRANGCDPLVITADNYIVSGHRRHVALSTNGAKWVKCRVLPRIRESYSDDEYVALLRAYNHQRQKTVAEQVREELIDANPEDAHRKLRDRRDRSVYAAVHNGAAILSIEGTGTRHGISDQKEQHVDHVKRVVFTDRKDYWPLSVRGVHYALLNYTFLRNVPQNLAYLNDAKSYDATSDLVTRMRLKGWLPWDAIDDGTRPVTEFCAFADAKDFLRSEADNLFDGYWRDLLQTQPCHIEVLCEKNTIYPMALRVTKRYQIPTSSGRGFSSIDAWHDLYQRYRDSGKERLIVVVLSDFDPEGEQIPHVGGRILRDDFGVGGDRELSIIKAGVTPEQIRKYGLPCQNFAKESSSNLRWFAERNGGDKSTYELEALKPEDMLNDLEGVIKSVIDVDLFNREAALEKQESSFFEAARSKVKAVIQEIAA